MLIKALCDYYDKVMVPNGNAVPVGYEMCSVTHTIHLNPDGTIHSITNCTEEEPSSKKNTPKNILLPKRASISGVSCEIIEHRPIYIFGLNYDKKYKLFSPNDKTNKAKKSFESFKKINLKFIEGIDSPIVNAYRNFMLGWIPENEVNNKNLIDMGSDYSCAYCEFRLAGELETALHEDPKIKAKWDTHEKSDCISSQCAICGEVKPIARIHNKIKSIVGGMSAGTLLVSFEGDFSSSYGKQQSYNSNISTEAMSKYTEALNYIIGTKRNKILLGDINVIFFALDKQSSSEDWFSALLGETPEPMNSGQTEQMLKTIISDAQEGKINLERLSSPEKYINEDADFYIVGLKPNKSRLSLKFIYRKKYGDILYNIAKHQCDMQLSKSETIIPLWKIKSALAPPQAKKKSVDPEIITKIFKSIVYNRIYPESLFSKAVQRVKSEASISEDCDDTPKEKSIKISRKKIQMSIIKGCVNRKSKLLNKEELSMALDETNQNPAYLCGRLFAVLERLQEASAGKELNRTIKNSYFSCACSRPSTIFPQILKLSQYHLEKIESEKAKIFFKKLVGQIIDKLENSLPRHLSLDDQGRFIIGYYQQTQEFYKSKEEKNNKGEI